MLCIDALCVKRHSCGAIARLEAAGMSGSIPMAGRPRRGRIEGSWPSRAALSRRSRPCCKRVSKRCVWANSGAIVLTAICAHKSRGCGANVRHLDKRIGFAALPSGSEDRVPDSGRRSTLNTKAAQVNCPLRMRCISSMPAIVIAALRDCSNPNIAAMRCLTLRWSCSIRLLRYFDDRSLVSVGREPSAFSSRTAR
jgi:hypothetical protein